jgi:hypothetical protein
LDAPEPNDPATRTPPPPHGAIATPAATQNQQPGLVFGLCSIAAGLIGFSVPVLGMIASCAGIWLGVRGFHQGRPTRYIPGVVCGLVGVCLSILGIVLWVCAILFESYH